MKVGEVEILTCSVCGAPLALPIDREGEAIACSHCGASAPVPEAHRALRQARRNEEDTRRCAERALASLDRPPSFALRLLAAIFDQPAVVIWFWWSIPLLLTSILGGLKIASVVAARFGGRSSEDAPMSLVLASIALLLLLLVFIPRAIGIFANRRATARARLLAAMMARPPAIEGGAFACRLCGAPIDLPDRATVARCLYCACDNVARLRSGFPRKVARAAASVGRSIDRAVELDRRQRADLRRRFWRELAVYVVSIAGFFGIWAIAEASREQAETRGATSSLYPGLLMLDALLLIVGAVVAVVRWDAVKRDRADRIDDEALAGVRLLAAIGMPILYFLSLRLLAFLL